MTALHQLAIAFSSILVLLGLMALLRKIGQHFALSAELQRKLVHLGTGVFALSWPWLFPDRWPAYLLVLATLIVLLTLRLPVFARQGVGSTLHGVERRSYGDILLAIAAGICLFLSEDLPYLYVLPVAVLTLSDAAAALAGSTYGTRFFKVEDGQKSIEGTIVFFTVTLVISLITLMLMSGLPALNIVLISVIVAGFGALVEAASWRGFDNLFLPVSLLILLDVSDGKTVSGLLVMVAEFAITLLIFRVLSRQIGLRLHLSRVYVTITFLLLAVTSFPNAVTPVLVLAAHIWCQSARSSQDRFPDLDIVAGITLISLGWLMLGRATGWNAVSFYGISAMGMAAGFSVLALSRESAAQRIAAMSVILSGLFLIRLWVLGANGEQQDWNGAMWGAVFASLFFVLAPVSLRPQQFDHDRVLRITLLAIAVPAGVYLFSTRLMGLLA